MTMNEELTEDRNYGRVVEHHYTPIAPKDMAVLKGFSSLDPKLPYTKVMRMHWAKLRLFDAFSRNGDIRCRDKAKELGRGTSSGGMA